MRVIVGADVCALIWIFTPTVFWSMIRELYGVGGGRIVESDAQVVELVRRWTIYDWRRVLAIAVAFLLSVRAIRVPFPGAQGPQQFGVMYGTGYAGTTGRRDGLGAGG